METCDMLSFYWPHYYPPPSPPSNTTRAKALLILYFREKRSKGGGSDRERKQPDRQKDDNIIYQIERGSPVKNQTSSKSLILQLSLFSIRLLFPSPAQVQLPPELHNTFFRQRPGIV